jgi:hypothetical protein
VACPQVADKEDSLQIGRLAVNILKRQPQTAGKRWPSACGLGRRLTTPHCKKKKQQQQHVTNYYTGPQTWQVLVNTVTDLQVPQKSENLLTV